MIVVLTYKVFFETFSCPIMDLVVSIELWKGLLWLKCHSNSTSDIFYDLQDLYNCQILFYNKSNNFISLSPWYFLHQKLKKYISWMRKSTFNKDLERLKWVIWVKKYTYASNLFIFASIKKHRYNVFVTYWNQKWWHERHHVYSIVTLIKNVTYIQ